MGRKYDCRIVVLQEQPRETRHEIKRSRKKCADVMKCQPAKHTSHLTDVISLLQKIVISTLFLKYKRNQMYEEIIC